jgi:hypothetical protein
MASPSPGRSLPFDDLDLPGSLGFDLEADVPPPTGDDHTAPRLILLHDGPEIPVAGIAKEEPSPSLSQWICHPSRTGDRVRAAEWLPVEVQATFSAMRLQQQIRLE